MKSTSLALLLTCFALTAGCIHENTDDCDSTVLLRFSYTGDGDDEIFCEKITRLDLYVFDENHQVVEGYDPYLFSADELEGQSVTMKLPTGQTYHAVCVGNPNCSVTHGLHEGTVYDTKLMHPVTHPDIDTGDDVIEDFDHLYHGEVQFAPKRAGKMSVTIPVNASHYDMIVEVAGHENLSASTPSRAEGDPAVSIEHEGVPGWVDFSNQCSTDESDKISKHPKGVLVEDPNNPGSMVHIFDYCVKRDVRDSKIHVRDVDGTLVGTVDVSAFLDLEENSEIKAGLENNQEAILPIRIDIKRVGEINVSISNWGIIKAKPEF